MFRKEQPEVLVAGAGPVGMFLALRLVEQGVRAAVVDEAWNRTARSYALALHPATLALLDRVGLAGELVRAGHRIEAVSLFDRRRRRAELRLAALAGDFPFALVLPQSAFERALERRLARAGVAIRWNHRVAGVEPGAERVGVRVERLGKDSTGYGVATTEWVIDKTFELTPAFAVGTDGHRSAVRRSIEAGFTEVGPAQTFAVFEFAAEEDDWHDARVILTDDGDNVVWPLGGGRFRAGLEIGATASAKPSPRRKDRLAVQVGTAELPLLGGEELTDLLAQRAPWFDAELGAVGWSVAVRFERRLAEPFGCGRVWLAGDAGHLAAPIGVQSMNVGLREADDLAGRLAAVLRHGASLDGLGAYGQERRAEWRGLFGLEGGAAAREGTDPWIAARAGRLAGVLPASGGDLKKLLGQVGVGWG